MITNLHQNLNKLPPNDTPIFLNNLTQTSVKNTIAKNN